VVGRIANRACEPSQRLLRLRVTRQEAMSANRRCTTFQGCWNRRRNSRKTLWGLVNPYANQDSKIYICEVFVQANAVSGWTPNDREARKFNWLATTACGIAVRAAWFVVIANEPPACQTGWTCSRCRYSILFGPLRGALGTLTAACGLTKREEGSTQTPQAQALGTLDPPASNERASE
jgi:hypothetical protein